MLLRFDPIDTLFFRDGRPYHQGENTQTHVLSRFPPSPATLVGASRAALARGLGWSGRGAWTDAIRTALGGDGDQLQGLSFRGPLLLAGDQPWFPVPASVIGCAAPAAAGDETPPMDLALLRPASTQGLVPMQCDLGAQVELPAGPPDGVEGRKLLEDFWMCREGLSQVLGGQVPSPQQLCGRKSLWVYEPRVGIKRNWRTRATEQGALYSPIHARPCADVALAMLVDGFPWDTQLLQSVQRQPQPLGGESRAVWISNELADETRLFPELAPLQPTGNQLNYSLYVASPLALEAPPLPNAPLPLRDGEPAIPGDVVSACLPRPQLWGGWSSVAGGQHRGEPQALRPYLAPGSLLYLRADAANADAVRKLHGRCIGARASWGYGLVFVGAW